MRALSPARRVAAGLAALCRCDPRYRGRATGRQADGDAAGCIAAGRRSQRYVAGGDSADNHAAVRAVSARWAFEVRHGLLRLSEPHERGHPDAMTCWQRYAPGSRHRK